MKVNRNSVKVVLLNNKNQIALMCADDKSIINANGEYNGRFWFTLGGKIEVCESLLDAAKRELLEETGIKQDDVKFSKEIWYGTVDLFLHGELTAINQRFIVAYTDKENFDMSGLTDFEKNMVKKIAWFSLDDIKNSKEVIYPVGLAEYLEPILRGELPETPIEIDLSRQPR